MADTSERLIAEAMQASQALSQLNRGPDVLVTTIDNFKKLRHRIGAREDAHDVVAECGHGCYPYSLYGIPVEQHATEYAVVARCSELIREGKRVAIFSPDKHTEHARG